MLQDSNVRYLERKAKIIETAFEPVDIDFEMTNDDWANGLVYVRMALKMLKLDQVQLAAAADSLKDTPTPLPELVEDLDEVAHFLKSLAEACTAARQRMWLILNRRVV
jgi:hypothetical protein